MKKLFFILNIIFLGLVSCDNNLKHRVNVNKKDTILKKIHKKEFNRKGTNHLPFGYSVVSKYFFENDKWYDDENNVKIQELTTGVYKISNSIKTKRDTVSKIHINKIIKHYTYFSYNNKKYKYKVMLDSIIDLYLLYQSKKYDVYFANINIKYYDNVLFDRLEGEESYLLTVKDGYCIESLLFSRDITSKKDVLSQRDIDHLLTSYSNFTASYIDTNKIITTINFKRKEWDMSYEYQLVNKEKYQITEEGKINKL